MKHILLLLLPLISSMAYSQQSELMFKYRQMALEYNHDIKSAIENISASMEMVGAAKADLKPKLGGGVSYQYVGNPTELNLGGLDSPLHFQGPNNRYGASVALTQPIYLGGRLLASLKKAELQHDYAQNEALLLQSVVSQQSDVTYWNSVARGEMVTVAQESKRAVEELVKTVRQRVELGYTDPNDLLMAEVKLNEAQYALQQAQTAFATSVMSLNSLVGVDLENRSALDSSVVAITHSEWLADISSNLRPEQMMAQKQIEISQSDKKIVRSKYLPQLYVGGEGVYQNPAYDFSRTLKPNYNLYAKLSVPIFEWNKRGKESRAAQSRVNIATQNLQKVNDKVELEVSTSRLALTEAIEQVNLTQSSLAKAFENERQATERYTEGKLSIVEVLQSQLYRQSAQVNYIQAKLTAQNSWSELQRALNLYTN